MKRFNFPIVVALFLIVGALQAQTNGDSRKNNINDALETTDSATHATVNIHQDKRIDQLLVNKRRGNTSDQLTNGFRVQVYSSNNQRIAKSEAFRIEKQIKDVFPDDAVYVNYTSPFWKVRIGDCKSRFEAQALRSKLTEAFPNLKSEIYIVREQIVLSGSK